MDPRVQKDTVSIHWVLNQQETSGFVGNLFNDKRLFPAKTTVKSILDHLEVQGIWASNHWHTFPDPGNFSEENDARFFNQILNNLPNGIGILCDRQWTGKGANKPLNGFSGAVRKPDLILGKKTIINKCDIKKEHKFDLRTDVYIISEEKSCSNLRLRMGDMQCQVSNSWALT
ncbi:hypothetical protein OG21DRAFT_1487635 [Imleria badia]|nr:hypothetical protein OG21DRAFT_1487635 [Imleria badia]